MSYAIYAVITGLAATAAIPAQLPPSGAGRATLLQLSVQSASSSAAELRRVMVDETAKITSCSEGLRLGERLKARGLHGSLSFNIKTDVPIEKLPAPLRDALLAQPMGRATPVFGGQEALRVLIRCEPGFVVPTPTAPKPQRSAVSI